VVVAVAEAKEIAAPAGFEGVASDAAAIAASLLSGEAAACCWVTPPTQHPQARAARRRTVDRRTDRRQAGLPDRSGQHRRRVHRQRQRRQGASFPSRQAYLLLNAEPELDAYNPQAAAPR
jgi:NADH-quinone oxidoreductase subunit G